ncbi:MAG: hypothetical protein Q7S33_00335 [Nanoarchaeota archaeon]|nr:hypothetical protein [Nanoarchaeota archaeon]
MVDEQPNDFYARELDKIDLSKLGKLEIKAKEPLKELKEIEILTMSARDYCDTQGRNLNFYNAKGVNMNNYFEGVNSIHKQMLSEVMKIVPEAEVIVDYKVSIISNKYSSLFSASGTALIPKSKSGEYDY